MVVDGGVAILGMALFVVFVYCGITIWVNRNK